MKILEFGLALAVGLLAGCAHKPAESSHSHRAAAAVQTITLRPIELPATYEATGTVRAQTTAVVSSKVMGYVREVGVRPGDRVRQGQWLVRLDARELEAAWRQAQASLEEARSGVPEADSAAAAAKAALDLAEVTFRRMQDLFEKRSVSNQEFDEASARLKLAKANYEMAEARRRQLAARIRGAEQAVQAAAVARGYAEIAAPFDGLVTEKSVEPGNLAAPGAPLLTIERDGRYRLETSVEESRLAAIHVGQAVRVRLDAPARELEGRVSEIVPAVDAAARAFVVKIDLPATGQLRSGVFGRAVFTLGRRQALVVPAAAVMESGQLASVFVVENGRARLRLVTLGARLADGIEALSGLNPGERVIAPLPAGLSEGAQVEARP